MLPIQVRSLVGRLAFAVVTASLLLAEIALTRLFSGTIGYYFAFMSISVAMLGLGAGSLWVTLRGELSTPPETRAANAALALSWTMAGAIVVYLRFYPAMGDPGITGQLAYLFLFGALFLPFLCGGILLSVVFESNREQFGIYYAIDLIGAAVGCVFVVFLLDHIPAPKALLVIAAIAGLAYPMYRLANEGAKQGLTGLGIVAAPFLVMAIALNGSSLFSAGVIRNQVLEKLEADEWNDFSRVIVKKGDFYTWGLSAEYTTPQPKQFDLLIEGVAGTQIQDFHDRDFKRLAFFDYDIASTPHLLRPTGSTLVLGVGAGFDVMMAKYYGKEKVVGVEVNPLVGKLVNERFGDYSGRPYQLPGVTIHYENARTYVKRDRDTYDIVTVTWVDSGAATGAGAFALTENYLYTVEAFKDYLSRLNDNGILAFMRSRFSPEYDAIKGIGIAVEAMRQLGIQNPENNIVVTSVKSPHFGWRELTHVLIKRKPFTEEELNTIDGVRTRLKQTALFTPGRQGNDMPIERLIKDTDKSSVYSLFKFDIEPTTDDRPFYFFLREIPGHPAGNDVLILRQSIITIVVLIALFLVAPLVVLLRRGVDKSTGVFAPTLYFSMLGLGFMLVEMKLLQQSVLVVGNPTLSLSAVLAALLLSTGIGALITEKFLKNLPVQKRGFLIFPSLVAVLLAALFGSEPVAAWLTGFSLPVRTLGLVAVIAPLGILLGCPLPLGMATLREKGLVAWSWGINGMLGVAGSGIAVYVAIYRGLRVAFLFGVVCYVLAAIVYLFKLAKQPSGEQPTPAELRQSTNL